MRVTGAAPSTDLSSWCRFSRFGLTTWSPPLGSGIREGRGGDGLAEAFVRSPSARESGDAGGLTVSETGASRSARRPVAQWSAFPSAGEMECARSSPGLPARARRSTSHFTLAPTSPPARAWSRSTRRAIRSFATSSSARPRITADASSSGAPRVSPPTTRSPAAIPRRSPTRHWRGRTGRSLTTCARPSATSTLELQAMRAAGEWPASLRSLVHYLDPDRLDALCDRLDGELGARTAAYVDSLCSSA